MSTEYNTPVEQRAMFVRLNWRHFFQLRLGELQQSLRSGSIS